MRQVVACRRVRNGKKNIMVSYIKAKLKPNIYHRQPCNYLHEKRAIAIIKGRRKPALSYFFHAVLSRIG